MKIIITENQFRNIFSEGIATDMREKEFIDAAKEKHQDDNGNPLYDYSLVDYKNKNNNKVKIICPRHKEELMNKFGHPYFEMEPAKHLAGQRCRFDYLDAKTIHKDDNIRDIAKKYKSNAEFIANDNGTYVAARKKGAEGYHDITSHFDTIKGSNPEEIVSIILSDNEYIDKSCVGNKNCSDREKKFKYCTNELKKYCHKLPFDFYIPKLNVLVEYDGEQHFHITSRHRSIEKLNNRVKNDKLKNKFAEENGIPLIRIPYTLSISKIGPQLIDALENGPKGLVLLGDYPKEGWNSPD